MNLCKITHADLLTAIEEVGFGKAVIGGADQHGVVVDGYLDLTLIAKRINLIIEMRNRSQHLIDHEQAR